MKFNLIDEPWIPVTMKDGLMKLLGIREVLHNATNIRQITHSSPMVASALERMLLAVLYRALNGPQNDDEALELTESGLDREKIDAYLERMHNRFWLFHETHPFFQIPWMQAQKKDDLKPWLVLSLERNSANSKVVFDHTMFTAEAAGPISYAQAAQYLVGINAYAPSKGKSSIAHTLASPASNTLIASPVGEDLEKTLILCLVPQNAEVFMRDLAVWEDEVPTLEQLRRVSGKSGRTICHGNARLYSWRSRSVKLIDDGDGTITNVLLASGEGFDSENEAQANSDPMGVYVKSEKYGKRRAALKERGAWRGFGSLLPDADGFAPKVIEHAVALTRGSFGCGWAFSIQVVTCVFNSPLPNVILWRRERFAVPLEVDLSSRARTEMEDLLKIAEDGASILNEICVKYAGKILSHGDRKVLKDDANKFIKPMPFLRVYWGNLERAFHQILVELSSGDSYEAARSQWIACILDEFKNALGELEVMATRGGGWSIRAYCMAVSGNAKKPPKHVLFLSELKSQLSQCSI